MSESSKKTETTFATMVTYVDGDGPLLKICHQKNQIQGKIVAECLAAIAPYIEKNVSEIGELLNESVSSVCAKYNDGFWYRGHVISIIDSHNVRVHFIDYGNTETIHVDNIRSIDKSPVSKYPPLASEIYLFGVVSPTGEWTQSDAQNIKDHILNYEVEVRLRFQIKDQYECASVKTVDGDLADFIIKQGIGLPSSKQSFIDTCAEHFQQLEKAKHMEALGDHVKTPALTPGSRHEIYMTNLIHNDGLIWVNFKNLDKAQQTMMNLLVNEDLLPLQEPPSHGLLCAAKAPSADNNYCRAHILNFDHTSCNITFVDYGYLETVKISDLRELPSFYKKLAYFSKKLYWLNFVDLSYPVRDITQFLQAQFVEIPLTMEVHANFLSGIPYCSLFHENENIINLIKLNLQPEVGPDYDGLVLEINDEQEVVVCDVNTKQIPPWSFHVQIKQQQSGLQTLMEKINQHCTAITPKPNIFNTRGPILAKYEQDGAWYRAEVLTSDGDHAQVKYVDFGNVDTITEPDARQILKEFVEGMPAQAIPCQLFILCNADKAKKFEEVALEETLMMRVLEKTKDGCYVVKMWNKISGKNINEYLDIVLPIEELKPSLRSANAPATNIEWMKQRKLVLDPPGLPEHRSDPQLRTRPGRRQMETERIALIVDDFLNTQYEREATGVKRSDTSVRHRGEKRVYHSKLEEMESAEKWPHKANPQPPSSPESLLENEYPSGPNSMKSTYVLNNTRSNGDNRPGPSSSSVTSDCRGHPPISTPSSNLKVEASPRSSMKIAQPDSSEYSCVEKRSRPSSNGPFKSSLSLPTPQLRYMVRLINNGRILNNVALTAAHQSSPRLFWLTRAEPTPLYQKMMFDIAEDCTEDGEACLIASPNQLEKGDACVVLSTHNKEAVWLRAEVERKMGNMVHVNLVDVGGWAEAEVPGQVRCAVPHMIAVSPQSIKCQLRGASSSHEVAYSEQERANFVSAINNCSNLQVKIISNMSNEQFFSVVLRDQNSDLSINELFGASPADLGPRTTLSELVLPRGTAKQVSIAWFYNPSKFYVFLQEREPSRLKMPKVVQESVGGCNLENASPGTLALARLPEDPQLYRCVVAATKENKVKIIRIDFGDIKILDVNRLRPMPESLMVKPPFAVLCRLSDVAPISGKDWPTNDPCINQAFQLSDTFTMRIEGHPVDNCFPVRMRSSCGTNVSRRLVDTDVAKWIPLSEAEPLLAGIETEVLVIHHEPDLSHFYVHVSSLTGDLDFMQEHLNAVVTQSQPCIKYTSNQTLIAVKCCNDQYWYRAKCLGSGTTEVPVFLVDYGLVEKANEFRNLPDKFINTPPPYATKCRLAVTPPLGGAYSEEAVTKFSKFQHAHGLTLTSFLWHEDTLIVDLILHNQSFCHYLIKKESAVQLLKPGIVSSIESLSELFIQLNENEPMLLQLQQELKVKKLCEVESKQDLMCVAKFDEDQTWYRALIKSVTPTETKAYFIDYGNTEIATEFREMPAEMKSIEPLAVKCSMKNIPKSQQKCDAILNLLHSQPDVQIFFHTPTEVTLLKSGINVKDFFDAEPETNLPEMKITEKFKINLPHDECDLPKSKTNEVGNISLSTTAKKVQETETKPKPKTNEIGISTTAKKVQETETKPKSKTNEIGNISFSTTAKKVQETETKPKPKTNEIGDISFSTTAKKVQETETKSKTNEIGDISLSTTAKKVQETETKLPKIEMNESESKIVVEQEVEKKCEIDNDNMMNAYLSHVVSPYMFWLHHEKEFDKLDELQVKLQNLESNLISNISADLVCAAQWTDDRMWYRARILSSSATKNQSPRQQVNKINKALFIDYGNIGEVGAIKELPENLTQIPPFATLYTLKNVPEDLGGKLSLVNYLKNETDMLQVQTDEQTKAAQLFKNGTNVVEVSKSMKYEPKLMDFTVCNYVNPNDFYINFCEDINKILDLSETLAEHAQNAQVETDQENKIIEFEEGMCCMAKMNEVWYRAVILNISPDFTIQAFFLDLGQIADAIEFKVLPQHLSTTNLSAFAKPCFLSEPPSPADTFILEQILCNGTFQADFSELKKDEAFGITIYQNGESISQIISKKNQLESENEIFIDKYLEHQEQIDSTMSSSSSENSSILTPNSKEFPVDLIDFEEPVSYELKKYQVFFDAIQTDQHEIVEQISSDFQELSESAVEFSPEIHAKTSSPILKTEQFSILDTSTPATLPSVMESPYHVKMSPLPLAKLENQFLPMMEIPSVTDSPVPVINAPAMNSPTVIKSPEIVIHPVMEFHTVTDSPTEVKNSPVMNYSTKQECTEEFTALTVLDMNSPSMDSPNVSICTEHEFLPVLESPALTDSSVLDISSTSMDSSNVTNSPLVKSPGILSENDSTVINMSSPTIYSSQNVLERIVEETCEMHPNESVDNISVASSDSCTSSENCRHLLDILQSESTLLKKENDELFSMFKFVETIDDTSQDQTSESPENYQTEESDQKQDSEENPENYQDDDQETGRENLQISDISTVSKSSNTMTTASECIVHKIPLNVATIDSAPSLKRHSKIPVSTSPFTSKLKQATNLMHRHNLDLLLQNEQELNKFEHVLQAIAGEQPDEQLNQNNQQEQPVELIEQDNKPLGQLNELMELYQSLEHLDESVEQPCLKRRQQPLEQISVFLEQLYEKHNEPLTEQSDSNSTTANLEGNCEDSVRACSFENEQLPSNRITVLNRLFPLNEDQTKSSAKSE